MNIPNRITLARFALALGLFAYMVMTGACSGSEWWPPAIVAGVFVLVVTTDALDGYLARRLGQQSDFGRIADPVVDKILVCGMLVFVASSAWGRVAIPVWMVVLIISREFMVSGLRGFIEARGVAFPARWDGKLKMVLQCVVIPAVFVQRALSLGAPGHEWLSSFTGTVAWLSVWLMFAVTLTSGASYVAAAARVLRSQP